MTIDQDGIEFIKEHEGFSSHPYTDVAGKWTVGIGHLIKPHEDFSMGISIPQAETLLYTDLAPVEDRILTLASNCNQNQFNALCSFGFNLGVGALQTMMSHGFDQIPSQILRWNHAGGKQVDGLTKRRAAEAALFVQ